MPRGPDPVAADPKYTLTPGPEKANWRYLHNWIWTENGQPKHALEEVLREPPCRSFGHRRMFVSPAGNGVLVTGNAYAGEWLKGKPAPLFVFLDPQGHRDEQVMLADVLTAEEQQLGKCPNCDCKDVLHVFAEDPALTANGCFVELKAARTRRPIAFFLPLGLPVFDREGFDAALAASEWAAMTDWREWHTERIPELVQKLLADDLGARVGAADELVGEGYLALEAVRKARASASSDDVRSRFAAVESLLRPWRVRGWDAMSIDLGLLASLVASGDDALVHAVRPRVARLLPQTGGMDGPACARWIEAHRKDLQWNATKSVYEGG